LRRWWRIWLQPALLLGSAKVALIVGTLLNLINQGDVLWGQGIVSAWHLLLNYLVPFGVSSFSAAQQEWRRSGGLSGPENSSKTWR
jgi:hypothetical protein